MQSSFKIKIIKKKIYIQKALEIFCSLPFDFVQGDGVVENGLLLCHFYDALRPQFKFCEQKSVRYHHSFTHSIEHAEKSVPALAVETPSRGDKTET